MFSIARLKEYIVDKLPLKKTVEVLGRRGLRSDPASGKNTSYEHIFVGEVLSFTRHPNADRLQLVSVSLGDQVIEPVVCGAFNFGIGDKVALALPGATIAQNIHSETHESFILGRAKIRGVESKAMLCSAFELGLSQEVGSGIILLPPSATPGAPLASYYP